MKFSSDLLFFVRELRLCKGSCCSNILYLKRVMYDTCDILLYIRDAVEMFMRHHASEDVTCLDVTES